MANFKTYFIAGVTVGVALNAAKQWTQREFEPSRRFDWGEMFAWGVGGGAIASLPDLLEPATSPNHRGFFHSLFFAALILAVLLCKSSSPAPQSPNRELLNLSGLTYLSHLALDIITPIGLPLI